MRALVIDDSRTVRTIIGKMLREVGFEVTEAGNGREGLDRLREGPGFDLAMVDWNIPELTGIEFIRAVRAERAHDGMRLMMVTAETEAEQVAAALAAGANEYVMKPFNRDVILDKLKLMSFARR